MQEYEIHVPFTKVQTVLVTGAVVATIAAEDYNEAVKVFKARCSEGEIAQDDIHLTTLENTLDVVSEEAPEFIFDELESETLAVEDLEDDLTPEESVAA